MALDDWLQDNYREVLAARGISPQELADELDGQRNDFRDVTEWLRSLPAPEKAKRATSAKQKADDTTPTETA